MFITCSLSVTVLCKRDIPEQGSASFSVKGQMVNILAFVAHMVSDEGTHSIREYVKHSTLL